jgi:hypothetical protein
LRIGDFVQLPFCGTPDIFKISRIFETSSFEREERILFEGQSFFATPETITRHATEGEILLWKLEHA